MAGHGDSAGVGVIVDVVALDEIVADGAGFVRDENAAGVVVDFIAEDRGVVGGDEVNAFAAIHLLAGLPESDTGTHGGGGLEGFVVVVDVVAEEGDVGGVGDEDAFVVGVANGESGDENAG